MAQSLSKVYVHIVFSTKKRENRLDEIIESAFDFNSGTQFHDEPYIKYFNFFLQQDH